MSLVAEAFVSQIAGSLRGRRRGGGGDLRGERAGVNLQPWVEGAEPTAHVEAAMEAWPHFPDEETEDTWPRSPRRGRALSTLPWRALFPSGRFGCEEEAWGWTLRWGRGHRFSPRLPQGFCGSRAASLVLDSQV